MAAGSTDSWRVVLFTDFPQLTQWYLDFFADRGHRIVAIVTSSKRNPAYVDLVAAAPLRTDVIVSNHPHRWYGMLSEVKLDLIVSTIFPLRIPDDVLHMAPLGAVNAHPTLLPRYRGTGPIKWMLWNDEREGGWTLHRMVADFDAGPVLAQSRFPIDDDDDVAAMNAKLGPSLPALWEAGLPRIARGDVGEPQDESLVLHVGPMPPEMQIVDWSRTAREVHNQVRAMSGGIPPHGAIADVDGRKLMLHRTRLTPIVPASMPPPGSIVSTDNDIITIQCGDRPLEVVAWEVIADPQPEAAGG